MRPAYNLTRNGRLRKYCPWFLLFHTNIAISHEGYFWHKNLTVKRLYMAKFKLRSFEFYADKNAFLKPRCLNINEERVTVFQPSK